MKKPKLLALILCLAMIVSVAAGCGPKPGTTTATTKKTDQTTTTTSGGGEKDKYGGTMVMATNQQLNQPNFLFISSTVDGILRDLIYDKLFTVDQDLNVIPRLATDYQASDDNKTFIVHLRKDVKWADGTPFTAQDVLCYFDVFDRCVTATKSNTWAEDYGLVITKEDDYTLKYELDRPCNTFVYSDLCQYVAMPYHIWKDADLTKFDEITDVKYLMGMGPFNITEIRMGEEIKLERNEHYWEMRPYLDGVTLRFIGDADSMALAFENGDVNLYRTTYNVKSKLEGQEGFWFHTAPSGHMTYILIDMQDEIMQDIDVRHAMSLLANREAMKMAANMPDSTIMTSIYTSADIGVEEKTMVEDAYTYDPEKAKKILDDAGWVTGADGIREKDGKKLKITQLSRADATAEQLIWVNDCKAAGIDITIKIIDRATLYTMVFTAEPDYQIFQNGSIMGPTCDGYELFYGRGTYNNYFRPEIQEMFARATAAPTMEEANRIYSEISQKVSAEYPCIWLRENVRYWGASDGLCLDDCGMTGFYCGWVSIAHAYFKK